MGIRHALSRYGTKLYVQLLELFEDTGASRGLLEYTPEIFLTTVKIMD